MYCIIFVGAYSRKYRTCAFESVQHVCLGDIAPYLILNNEECASALMS